MLLLFSQWRKCCKSRNFGCIGSLSSLQYHVEQSWHRRSFRFHLTEQIYLDTLITMQTAEGSIYNAKYSNLPFLTNLNIQKLYIVAISMAKLQYSIWFLTRNTHRLLTLPPVLTFTTHYTPGNAFISPLVSVKVVMSVILNL